MFDEASGVHRDFWLRAETMFGGHHGHGWLCLYNPNDSTSPAFAAEESGLWHQVTLSALEHPNILAELAGLPPPIPSAVRLSRVRDRIQTECREATEGEDGAFRFDGRWYRATSPEFEAQVLGEWPSQAASGVWSPPAVEACFRRVEIQPEWPVQIGCDVARFGDDRTAYVVRHGVAVVECGTLSGARSDEIADTLRRAAYRHSERPETVPVLVDDTGGYGSGVLDLLTGWNAVAVNASTKPRDASRYRNLRAELWFTTRTAADSGGVDLSRLNREQASTLRAELLAARYQFDEKGRRSIEPKTKMKVRLGRSPDLADAFNLAWYPAGDAT